ncbi:HipA domain-containing protein [Brevundimonas aveniformis]|uniref:HipA domain-containing protein n=1 Tax=Brevundimonas aveniformis TaxID=370977 RepID=UPI002492E592|nr:HipA domain-containing protein [Brevundimonas aveniformis]
MDVYLDGVPAPIGQLIAFDTGATAFQYGEIHVADPQAAPLSLSLPIQAAPYGDVATRAFFENLLPENDQMRRVMDLHGVDRSDFVGLLAYLGADCPGALSCVPSGTGPVKSPGVLATDYEVIGPAGLADLVRRMASGEPLPGELRDPSPVAGVQPKIALTVLPNGTYALPRQGTGAPTTHILKTPRTRDARDAELERTAALLAQATGLAVAVPELVNIGGAASLLIPRFDRRVADGVVYRLHQEDFAQALGLPASLKYERNGMPGRRFDIAAIHALLRRTATPALAIRAFLRLTVFNMCVGNADNHAKNHALLYHGGPTPILAPAYDLLPTRMNATLKSDMGFRIGNAETVEALTIHDMAQLFQTFGFSDQAAERFARDELAPMMLVLEMRSGDRECVPKDLDDLIGNNLERVSEACGLELPLRERDVHQPVGGGWVAS